MKLLVFLLSMSVSVPVFAAQMQLKLLREGKVSLQLHLYNSLAPVLYQHFKVAGEKAGLDAGALEKIFGAANIMSLADPEASDGINTQLENHDNDVFANEAMTAYALSEAEQNEEFEEMLADLNEHFLNAKTYAVSDIHGGIVSSLRRGEHHFDEIYAETIQKTHFILGIDFELAEKLVQATAMATKKGILFAQYSAENISERDLIEATRLLLDEHQELIEPSLQAELLEALELDSYPGGILGDSVHTAQSIESNE